MQACPLTQSCWMLMYKHGTLLYTHINLTLWLGKQSFELVNSWNSLCVCTCVWLSHGWLIFYNWNDVWLTRTWMILSIWYECVIGSFYVYVCISPLRFSLHETFMGDGLVGPTLATVTPLPTLHPPTPRELDSYPIWPYSELDGPSI